MVLSGGDTVNIPQADLLAPQPNTGGTSSSFSTRPVNTSVPVPNGFAAAPEAAGVVPVAVELGSFAQETILAGIASLDVTVSTPNGVNETAFACDDQALGTNDIGCDSMTFAGLGVKRSGSPNWELIDDQLTPLRGLGQHSVDMVGVAERLLPGDKFALLLYGQHVQFVVTFSRDATITAVNVNGTVDLPLYAVDENGNPLSADGQVLFAPGSGPAEPPICLPESSLCVGEP
jgi:ABC-2 type transport system ATP-binding protein